MNKTLEYINENYSDYIKGHSYVKNSEYSFLKKGYYVKAINRDTLKMDVNGTISNFPKTDEYIKVYNFSTKRCSIIYPKSYFIFIKKKETRDDKFKKSLLNFIKKVEINKNKK